MHRPHESRQDIPLVAHELNADRHVYPNPITGEGVGVDVIPESLMADERLAQGFAFWRDNAKDISFTLLLTAHGNASDLREGPVDLHAEAKKLGQENGVLFLELADSLGSRDSQAKMAAVANTVSRHTDPGLIARTAQHLRSYPDGGFVEETLAQITGTGVHVGYPDYAGDSDRPADRVLADIGLHSQLYE